MNGAWWGSWNPAPKAHPNDGLVDVVEARLHVGDLGAVRRRLPHGAHLPHPRIAVRRVAEVEVGAGPRLWLDGERVRAAGALRLVVEPDALTVVV
jgi:diacylglycerol kinase family enzyme